jgi:transcriptional regulator with XRE-family HTH domain
MALGKKIRELREAKGLSQDDLSQLTFGEVSQGAISALEKRDSTTSKHTSALAKALQVSLAQLQGGEEYQLNPKLAHLIKVAQELPDYAIDEVIRDAIKTAELIANAKADKNGTHK